MYRKVDSLLHRVPNSFPQNCMKLQCRHKNGPKHWSVLARKKTPKDRALDHFDDFYKSVFAKKWPSVRLGLLSPNKYCAIVNNYSDPDRIIPFLESLGAINLKRLMDVQAERINEGRKKKKKQKEISLISKLDKTLEEISIMKHEEELSNIYPDDTRTVKEFDNLSNESADRFVDGSLNTSPSALYEFIPATKLKGKEDWVPESQHYSYYTATPDFPVEVRTQDCLNFPSELHAYCFEVGNVTNFPQPSKGITGVYDYCLMDGSNLLPVLVLDLEPGDCVLDMCASPGNKSIICLQTLYPETVDCNDITESKTNVIRRAMKQYFYDFDKKFLNDKVLISQRDGRFINDCRGFNKILVDVPCTSDRHSVSDEGDNIFKPTRVKERIKLPEMQSQILINALKIVEPGGTVVYTTSSLSPIQNDGVVKMALKNISNETDIKIVVVDMKKALEPASAIFRFGTNIGLQYGHLVVPYLPANYGPMYFCKLLKLN